MFLLIPFGRVLFYFEAEFLDRLKSFSQKKN